MKEPVLEIETGVLNPRLGDVGLQLLNGGPGLEQVPLNEIGFGEQQEAAVGPFRTAAVLVELGKDGDLAAGRIAFCELDGREVWVASSA